MKNCPNCNFEYEPDFKFCPNCGQETQLDYTLKSLFSHFLSDYFTFDSKIIRSVAPLITKPAFLTKEHLAGKRSQYIQPLRLFIFLSIIFFLILSWLSPSTVSSTQIDGINNAFWDRFFESWLPKLFFFLLPLFALIISWLYRKKKLGLMPHFLFSLHFHSSLFLIGIIYSIISYFILKLDWADVNQIMLISFSIYLAVYLWKSLRKMYGENRKKTVWKILVLAFAYLFLLVTSSILLLALSLNY
ncbi:MAG: DUF3667 domain-containing protein [Flavobacteriales bacterium]|nr:DUF3667 domain-containing protein [Flavobacteriales bacterium]